jgi:hypothetical protein
LKRTTLDDLPLFADDASIGQALLGVARAEEWPSLVPIYERRGFPELDKVMGGRYVPAVKAFFDREYGIGGATLSAADGIEQSWKSSKRRA